MEQAILYGSRAKGNYLTLNVIYRILDDLDELLLPYAVHLSIFDHISDRDVIEHIQRVGVVFYEKPKP